MKIDEDEMFGRKPMNHDDEPQAGDPRHDNPPVNNPIDPDETQTLIDTITMERDLAVREREVALEQWKRAVADFHNFQRRAVMNEQEAKRQGITSVLNSIVPVLDHFDLALTQLEQAAGETSVSGIVEGVRVIRAELIRALSLHGVSLIEPKPGDTFEPGKHEALMQVKTEGVESGHIAQVIQNGYALGDRVIRSAKVGVAP